MAQNTHTTIFLSHFLLPLLVIGVLSFVTGPTVTASGISKSEVISLVNAAREKEGLPALRENELLSKAAALKAEDMIAKDYFAHTSPSGATPWAWIKKAGYSYKAAGENLAVNYSTAKERHAAWMKSPTHRSNILSSQYQEIGVAVVGGKIDGETSLVTVEFFGTPAAAVGKKPVATVPTALKAPAVKGVEAVEKGFVAVTPHPGLISDMTPLLKQGAEYSVATVKRLEADPLPTLELAWLVALVLLGLSIVLGPVVFLAEASHAPLHPHGRGASEHSKPQKAEKRLARAKAQAKVLVDGIVLHPSLPP